MSETLNSLYYEIEQARVFDKTLIVKIGKFVDLAKNTKSIIHTKKAIEYLDSHNNEFKSSSDKCLVHYFLSVAWSDVREYNRLERESSWDWEQEEIEKEIVNLRQAERLFDQNELPIERYCQILTNLGNLFDYIGRYIESFRCWNKAIGAQEHFGMAVANRGNSMIYHGLNSLSQKEYQLFFLQVGYRDLKYASNLILEEHAIPKYTRAIKAFEENYEHVLKESITLSKVDFTDKSQSDFLKWSLDKNLLLNPLIDIEHYEFALFDNIEIPEDFTEGRELFEQIKNEFRLARHFYYESEESSRSNLDKNERLKLSFRIAYSLFDKIAYLINNIFKLNTPLHRVDFHKLWFENTDKKRGIRIDLAKNNNFILRGLYWISKEMYYNEVGFRDSIEPDAQEIANIRNYLEHKSTIIGEPSAALDENKFSIRITQSNLSAKVLRLLLLTRECIIYVPLAINREIMLNKKTFDDRLN